MFGFFRKIKITYGITVCNEAHELETLLKVLIPYIKKGDEIIVLRDITFPDAEVDAVIKKYNQHIEIVQKKLDGDFSAFKNTLIDRAKGNYLFQIDADETPKGSLLKKLKSYIRKYYRADVFFVPRINIVHGITETHIQKWKWSMNNEGYFNFPDFQPRIVKLNSEIRWHNKVHETFTGFKRGKHLPADNYDYCLLHIKNIEKQEHQDRFYNTLTPS